MSEEDIESASSEGESEEGSYWSGESEEEVEDEDEPVLKYRRFATKEVVLDITQMAASREYALICCIAVHPKVPVTNFVGTLVKYFVLGKIHSGTTLALMIAVL